MSTKPNHRRGEPRTQDNNPRYETRSGDAPSVARARSSWKRLGARSERRTGHVAPGPKVGARSSQKVIHWKGRNRPRPDE